MSRMDGCERLDMQEVTGYSGVRGVSRAREIGLIVSCESIDISAQGSDDWIGVWSWQTAKRSDIRK